jgi:hypothetical protein
VGAVIQCDAKKRSIGVLSVTGRIVEALKNCVVEFTGEQQPDRCDMVFPESDSVQINQMLLQY